LTLNTDGAGLYWYSCESDFHKALSESLAGLENIIDELAGLIENENIPRIKQMYRKLSQMVEQ
jgi:hypothetical protein